ncbi:hypothetical protein QR77_15250 [Streptomyces sp. 150FB]|nr:hypothetical protein QR77_15250 [Streptomyces sp. 150FB]
MLGGWWTTKRGGLAGQDRVAFEVCEEPLSRIRWIVESAGTACSSNRGKAMKVTGSLRVMSSPRTCPVRTSGDDGVRGALCAGQGDMRSPHPPQRRRSRARQFS